MPRAPGTDGPGSEDYEELPYPGGAYRLTHVDCLATIATVFGLHPAPPDRCRVLELGCAGGLNLAPMAYALPKSKFVGIDTAGSHISAAESIRTSLRLKNIRFEQRNILEIDSDFGEFDYIICHGIFSWVPRPVQEKIFDICRTNLSANGIAYISYNTFPGWHLRGIIRDVMLHAAGKEENVHARVENGRRGVETLAALLDEAQEPYLRVLRDELRRVLPHQNWYLAHEFLAEHNEPLYFTEFVERAGGYRLQYLAEAGVSRMTTTGTSPRIQQTLAAVSTNIVDRGRWLDFLRNTMFRRSLLCRQGQLVQHSINPELLRQFRTSSRWMLQPGSTELTATFLHPRGFRIDLQHPIAVKILVEVSRLWPQCVPVETLLGYFRPEETGTVLTALTESYLSELIDLRLLAPACAGVDQSFSGVSPIALYLVKNSLPLVNLRHELVQLSPQQTEAFLRLAQSNESVDADIRAFASNALLYQ